VPNPAHPSGRRWCGRERGGCSTRRTFLLVVCLLPSPREFYAAMAGSSPVTVGFLSISRSMSRRCPTWLAASRARHSLDFDLAAGTAGTERISSIVPGMRLREKAPLRAIARQYVPVRRTGAGATSSGLTADGMQAGSERRAERTAPCSGISQRARDWRRTGGRHDRIRGRK